MRQPLILALLIAGTVHAQDLTARINDPMSHGTLRDNLLSLDEAVRLANDDLFYLQLSPAEQARVSGLGSLLSTIEIDFNVTPVITYQAELTPIVTVSHSHQDLALVGVNGRPVLDAGSFSAALPVRTNHLHARNVDLRNGQTGIDYDSTGHFHGGTSCELFQSVVSGQVQAGIRVRAPANAPGLQVPMKLQNVDVNGVAVGLDILDLGRFGAIVLEAEWVRFNGCTTAVFANVNSQLTTSTYEFFRCTATGGDNCIVVQRNAASDGQFFLRVLYGDWFANKTVFDIQGAPNADTIFHHHHVIARAGTGAADHALLFQPRTARFDVHGTENQFDGNITIQGNLNSRRLYFHTNHCRNGTFTLDWAGVPPDRNVHWNTFSSMPVVIAAGSRTPATFDQCEFVNSPINCIATLGTVTLVGCYLNSSPISGNVTNTNPEPAPWLGRASVTPLEPQIGGIVDFNLDLQPNMGAVWMLHLSEPRPLTTNDPFRFYLQGFRANQVGPLVVPGVYQLQDRLHVPIPVDPYLRGFEFYAQPVVFPTASQPYVFPFTLPAGGRFICR